MPSKTKDKGSARNGGGRSRDRRSSKALARAGTYGSSGGGIAPIVLWTLAFAVVGALVIGAALLFTQSNHSDSNALVTPPVSTPANIAQSGRTLGVASAPVTIDLYGDFRCSACYRFTMQGTEQQLIDNYVATGKARIVWHDRLVIDQLSGGTASRDAANAAWCGADQDKFWVMHDWLYANQSPTEDASAFTQSRLLDIGRAAGLDMTRYQACVQNGTHDAAITAEDNSEKATITGTPTIMVGGARAGAEGTVPSYDEIKSLVDQALANPSPSPS